MKRRGQHAKRERQDVDVTVLEAIVERTAVGPLTQGDRAMLGAAVETLAEVTAELERKGVSIRRLRRLLFGASTEQTDKVLAGLAGRAESPESDEEGAKRGNRGRGEHTPRTGHGRNGTDTLRAAERIVITHAALGHGVRCPSCGRGNLYAQRQAKKLVRIRAMAPITAAVYECERLRCGACGEILTAPAPAAIGVAKYDASVASMIALLKYGCGLPFYRIAKLQQSLGIPLPASTQWDLVHRACDALVPVWEELCCQAADGEVIHNDDTTMRILGFKAGGERDPVSDGAGSERRGVYTSGVVSKGGGHQIALFFTGRRHAGENLADLLARREEGRAPPIQMCDALSHNTAGDFATIVAHCMAHARRKFVDVTVNFPDQCRHVLEELAHIYTVDAQTRRQKMSDEQRLAHHQAESGPRMKKLGSWLRQQLDDKHVEPSSGAGEAITYMIKHWEKLTLFLRAPGAPLDNNLCERALKKAILHRKNALFYKTQNGARVGDLYMSLVYTAELAERDPFDYVLQMLRHSDAVKDAPQRWMPWSYKETVAAITGDEKASDSPAAAGASEHALVDHTE